MEVPQISAAPLWRTMPFSACTLAGEIRRHRDYPFAGKLKLIGHRQQRDRNRYGESTGMTPFVFEA